MEPIRELLVPVYQEGGRVQFWYLKYDHVTDTAQLGYELIGMPDHVTREPLGEVWHPFDKARTLLAPSVWAIACDRLAAIRIKK